MDKIIDSSSLATYLNTKVASHSKTMYTTSGYPTVQAYYGPYDSLLTAHKALCFAYGDFTSLDAITKDTKCTDIPRGITVGVVKDGIVVEYQYKKATPTDGYAESDLDLKQPGAYGNTTDPAIASINEDTGQDDQYQLIADLFPTEKTGTATLNEHTASKHFCVFGSFDDDDKILELYIGGDSHSDWGKTVAKIISVKKDGTTTETTQDLVFKTRMNVDPVIDLSAVFEDSTITNILIQPTANFADAYWCSTGQALDFVSFTAYSAS